MKIDRYWNCSTTRCFFVPYLQLGLEDEGWHTSLFIEVGWLSRWAAIEIEIKRKTFKPF